MYAFKVLRPSGPNQALSFLLSRIGVLNQGRFPAYVIAGEDSACWEVTMGSRPSVAPPGIQLSRRIMIAFVFLVLVLGGTRESFAFDAPTFVQAWGTPGSGPGQFNIPGAIAADPAGSFYVANAYQRVQKFDSTGSFLLAWGPAGPDVGRLLAVSGMSVGQGNNLYVAELNGFQVDIFSATGAFQSSWGSPGGIGGPAGTFDEGPNGVGCGPNGHVYASDPGNYRIQEFDATGVFVRKWGNSGAGDGQFTLPGAIAVAADGTVYVADQSLNEIQAFSSTGSFLRRWGSTGSEPGQMNHPSGLATDASGNVYVTDATNNRVQVFSSAGTYLGQWGSNGSSNGQFNAPWGIVVVGSSIYVLDQGNDRVQQFSMAPVAAEPTSWGKVKAAYR